MSDIDPNFSNKDICFHQSTNPKDHGLLDKEWIRELLEKGYTKYWLLRTFSKDILLNT